MRRKTILTDIRWTFGGIILLLAITCSSAATFKVTNSDSLGTGSLYWAIEQTQIRSGPDTVVFALTKSDKRYSGRCWMIYLASALPSLVDYGTFIDGFSQSSESSGPAIEIHGERAVLSAEGWQIISNANIIRGLSLGGFANTAITIIGPGAYDNVIAGCHIGCAADGKTRLRNRLVGIELTRGSHHNIIGGETPGLRNVLSGNGTYGIRIEDSHHNLVIGNHIGVDADGLTALPNGDQPRQQNCAGILLASGAKNNQIGNGKASGRNLLSGNARTGLRIEWEGAEYNTVKGNYLGLGSDGKTRIANLEAGLVIGRGASYNLIGGDLSGDANVISGNYSSGVQFARGSTKNVFKGNYVGTDAFLQSVVPNAHNGIYFYGDDSEGYPQDNTIGPANIICGNGNDPPSRYWAGLSLDYSGTFGNRFFGNYIGQDPSGRLKSGQPTGILVQRGSHDNTFGPGNVIAHSEYDGILIQNDNSLGNRITQNSIFNNKLLAIRNVQGGNAELPPPLIYSLDDHTLAGYAPAKSQVEIYSDRDDEAEQYLATVTSDSLGRFTWRGSTTSGRHLAALCIDPAGNTSMLANNRITPVELTDFSAVLRDHRLVDLLWRTASESNNYGFWVQREQHGEYQDRAFIAGAGTVTHIQSYTYQDTLSSTGDYRYRLKQVDLDGGFTYSHEILIKASLPASLSLYPVHPNPFNTTASIRYEVPRPIYVVIEILNLNGECVRHLFQGIASVGSHLINWDGRNDHGRIVGSGMLLVRMWSEDGLLTQKCLLLR